jgi:hypothetical protein
MNSDDIKKYRAILSESVIQEAPSKDASVEYLFAQHAIQSNMVDTYTNNSDYQDDRAARKAEAAIKKLEAQALETYGDHFVNAMQQNSELIADILYRGSGKEPSQAAKIRKSAGVDPRKYYDLMTAEFSGYTPFDPTPNNTPDPKIAATYMKAATAMDNLSYTLRILGSKRSTSRERNAALPELKARLAMAQKFIQLLGN